MIFFTDNNGTIIRALPSPVYQGAANTNNIYLIAPFASNLQFTVAFKLPNGIITEKYLMTGKGEIPGMVNEATVQSNAIWTYCMPNFITQYVGTVRVQFCAYGVDGSLTATSHTTFEVQKGVPVELPATPSQDIYDQILTALSQLNSSLENGTFAARAIYWWIDTFTYGMNEITFYPIGEYGALVRSIVTGNKNNQPYSDAGTLDDEHWQELVNFNKIFDALEKAVESAEQAAQSAAESAQSAQDAEQAAQSAAGSAQSAASSAQSAAGSAQSAASSATAAADSAQAAQESEQAAADSASNAEQSAEDAAQSAEESKELLNKSIQFVDSVNDVVSENVLYFVVNPNSPNLFDIYVYEDGAPKLIGTANAIVNNVKTFPVTLLHGSWVNNQQTVVVEGVETNDYVETYPENGYGDEWLDYGIKGTQSINGGVIFSCESVPEEDIPAIIQVNSNEKIPTVDGYYSKSESNSLFAATGEFDMNTTNYVITLTLKALDGTVLSTTSIDLPLESVVVDGAYDAENKAIVLTLKNGTKISIPVGDIVNGLATQTALNDEIAARTAADNNLSGRIDDIVSGTTVVGHSSISDNSTAAASASNVTSQIAGKNITDIFEEDGTTVKAATTAQSAQTAASAQAAVSAQTATSAESAMNAQNSVMAEKATADGDGNNITDTYATKESLAAEQLSRQNADTAIQSSISELSETVSKIENGGTSVGNAANDGEGNNIVATYATKNEVSQKQDITDNSLETTAKTIVGAINENNAAIDGLRNDVIAQDHFKGFAETAADVQEITADLNDYVYCIATGTIWIYGANGWSDSGKAYPSFSTPLSNSTPVMDGAGAAGSAASAARADHTHPSDTSRAAATDLQAVIDGTTPVGIAETAQKTAGTLTVVNGETSETFNGSADKTINISSGGKTYYRHLITFSHGAAIDYRQGILYESETGNVGGDGFASKMTIFMNIISSSAAKMNKNDLTRFLSSYGHNVPYPITAQFRTTDFGSGTITYYSSDQKLWVSIVWGKSTGPGGNVGIYTIEPQNLEAPSWTVTDDVTEL